MAKSPEEMLASMLANLEEKTGKKLDDWLVVVRNSGLSKHKEMLNYLKQEHGLTHGYANVIVHKAKEAAAGGPAESGDLVEAQYAGAKAGLRPVYDKLMTAVGEFGDDVEIAPKKAYVSLRRSKQFAIVQPSTKTRVDVGLNLKDRQPAGRLERSGSFNAMVSHRVRLASADDVDGELIGWLREAYEGA